VNTSNRYDKLRRNIVIIMIAATVIPLSMMAYINHHLFNTGLKAEIIKPLESLTNRTARSFELFFEDRNSSIKLIASLYSYQELSSKMILNRIFQVLKKEYCCYIDLGLINDRGEQINYVGPYDLLGYNYSNQDWFKEVMVKGVYISNVFMGYRKFPHVAFAVNHLSDDGTSWIVRATMDTKSFKDFIADMGLDQFSDAFLISSNKVLQTPSKFYGNELESSQLDIPLSGFGTHVIETKDNNGKDIFLAYAPFSHQDFTLVVVKTHNQLMRSMFALRSEVLLIFILGVSFIIFVILSLTNRLVKRVKESDEKRQKAFRELEHNHKLSSIGRLSTGVAHEINNPLAIINENAGLIKDYVISNQLEKELFLEKIDIVLNSVSRAKIITHRLLGFARRIEIKTELLNLNDILRDSIGFLEKEMLYRNIEIRYHLSDLPEISSDKGQLEQVFLNILTNALSAVEDGGKITISSWEKSEHISASIEDNGHGISEDSLLHIFEPFFTTKNDKGTGLGLSISFGIVKKLGGSIQAKSIEGEGSKFSIILPKNKKEDHVEKIKHITS
jgi:two-component system, NtrC family, sensor kinase